MKKITLTTLRQQKHKKEKIAMLTCYDASFARLLDKAGVDIILIGDSLGNVIQGHTTTLPVAIEDIAYHTRCVTRVNPQAFIMADMPFASYHSTEVAVENAKILMQAGAEMIKLEGGAWLCDTVKRLTQIGIPVCAHLGLQPQSVHKLGGFSTQGRDPHQAQQILKDASQLTDAGADLLILECVPSLLAEEITLALPIPVIGIGAGASCDGQVLVLYDALGISALLPKFSENFLAKTGNIEAAIELYINNVKQGKFPINE